MITHPKTQEGMQKFTKDIVLEYMDLLKWAQKKQN
jgi:hypothetical protein